MIKYEEMEEKDKHREFTRDMMRQIRLIKDYLAERKQVMAIDQKDYNHAMGYLSLVERIVRYNNPHIPQHSSDCVLPRDLEIRKSDFIKLTAQNPHLDKYNRSQEERI